MDPLGEDFTSASLNGLPKIFSAKRLSIRLFWTILVLGVTVGFSYHLYLLASRYSTNPINTQVTMDAVNFEFPSLYICNPFPFSYSQQQQAQHALTAAQQAELDKVDNIRNQALNEIRQILYADGRLNSTVIVRVANQGYTASSKEYKGGHTKHQSIIKATINDQEIQLDAFKLVPSEEYLSCFKFLRSSKLKSPSDVLTLYLYADITYLSSDLLTALTGSISFSGRKVDDKSSGLWLFVIEDGFYPGQNAEHIAVSCGMHTHVSVSMTSSQSINKPGNECRTNARVVRVKNHLQKNSFLEYKLDWAFCSSYEWALSYLEHCGCIPLQYPIPEEIRTPVYRCTNVSHFSVKQTVANIYCAHDLKENQNLKAKIAAACVGVEPCQRKTFDLQWSNTAWPAASLLESFVESVLNETYVARTKQNYSVPAWENVLRARENQLSTMVRENIVKVDIRPRRTRSNEIREDNAYPAINLFSDIGGILGLYLGMSLLSLFELIESLVQIMKALAKIKGTKNVIQVMPKTETD